MKNNTFKQTEIGEIPEKWNLVELRQVVDKVVDNRGKTPPTQDTGIELLEVNAIVEGEKFPDYNKVRKYVSNETYSTWFRAGHPEKNDILIPTVGTIGNAAVMHESRGSIAQNLVALRLKKDIADSHFVYYLLTSPNTRNKLLNLNIGGVQPSIKVPHLLDFVVAIPEMIEQQQIASILSSLDDKIELNRKMNKTLEEIGKALFKRWFVDFEFPNENGEPYKSSGGEMVESELGEIPKGWETNYIGNHMEIFDSQRIPLSSREREKRRGEFRYYGATGTLDYVDDFLFDGIYLLLGEDGTVTIDNGYPFTQYVWGKFWVNNHAHIIQGKEHISTEFLKLFFDSTVISSYVTGAVQSKLNQANLKSIPFILPKKKLLDSFQEVILPIFTQIRINSDEISHLSNLRDSLLPRLMNGKVRLKI